MVSREIPLKRYNVQHFEFVGADISRPKGNERELYRRTAQSRYPAGRQIAAPYELRRFWWWPFNRQLNSVTLRAANIRPYGLACIIHRTLNKERTAVALFSQPYGLPASPKGSFWWWPLAASIQHTALFRQVAGRQVAAPYELRRFFRLPFNQQLRPVTLRAAGIRPY